MRGPPVTSRHDRDVICASLFPNHRAGQGTALMTSALVVSSQSMRPHERLKRTALLTIGISDKPGDMLSDPLEGDVRRLQGTGYLSIEVSKCLELFQSHRS